MPRPFSTTSRSLADDRGTAARIAWAVSAVTLATWLGWFFFSSVSVVEVSQRARVEVRQATHLVTTAVPGRIVHRALTLGQPVAAGDVLAELDSTADTLRLREAQAQHSALVARVAALRLETGAREQAGAQDAQAATAAVQGALARVQEASAAAAFANDRDRRLRAESDAGSVATVEALQARAESGKLAAARDALVAEVSRTRSDALTRMAQQRAQVEGLRGALAALQGDLASNEAALARLALDVEKHRIRAPVAGRVASVTPLATGETVAAGQPFATVLPEGEMVVVAEFEPAAALGRVRPGQSAVLRLDGFPWTQHGTVAATVRQVASEIREHSIRVELTPVALSRGVAAGPPLQHGLPGSIEVMVEELAPAMMALRASGQWLAGGGRGAR